MNIYSSTLGWFFYWMDNMASQISVCLPASAGRQCLSAGVGLRWGYVGSVHDLQATGKAATVAGRAVGGEAVGG